MLHRLLPEDDVTLDSLLHALTPDEEETLLFELELPPPPPVRKPKVWLGSHEESVLEFLAGLVGRQPGAR